MAHANPVAKMVTIPIYNRPVILANDNVAAEKLLHKHFKVWTDMSMGNTCVGITCIVEEVGVIVVIVHDGTAQTLCHEAVHAAWETLRAAGVISDVDNQESLAYLTDWVFHAGMKALKLK